jgi:hypothetical protein
MSFSIKIVSYNEGSEWYTMDGVTDEFTMRNYCGPESAVPKYTNIALSQFVPAGDSASTYYLLPTITSSRATCYITQVIVVDDNTTLSDSLTMV